MINTIALINIPPSEFLSIVQTLRSKITKGRIHTDAALQAIDNFNAKESQHVELSTKYGTANITLVPLESVDEALNKSWGGFICDENILRQERLLEMEMVGELQMMIGNGKLLDWCIDNQIEYVDRTSINLSHTDEDNVEGIERIAEAIANVPWNMEPADKNRQPKAQPAPMPDEDMDDLEKSIARLMQLKAMASKTSDLDERHRIAEQALLELSKYLEEEEGTTEDS